MNDTVSESLLTKIIYTMAYWRCRLHGAWMRLLSI